MKNIVKFTVFTPTYNRGYKIKGVYDSLRSQSFKSFEWIVIDDGSTDDTETLFSEILKEDNFFEITYLKVQNGGKHRAINKGLMMAKGELFLCCDSDDYLTENCLEIANRVEGSIKNEDRKKYAGICGLRGGADLSIIGTSFTGTDYLDITFFEREKYGITGDKAEILYTEIWRHYLFPEISGENFLTEYVGLSKIAEEGLLVRYFNEVVRITEYLEDGLTCNSVNKFIQNPKGWGLYIGQLIRQGTLRGKKRFRKELEFV